MDILVSLYFYPKVFFLIRDGEFNDMDLLGDLIINVITIAVIYSIIIFGAIALFTKEEKKDERDRSYELKGFRVGYIIAQVCFFILIGVTVFNPMSYNRLGELTPPLLAMIILLIVVLSSIGKSLTQLYYYRKTN